MATYYIKSNTITVKEIREKFKAFELLYGKSKIQLRGEWVMKFTATDVGSVTLSGEEVSMLFNKVMTIKYRPNGCQETDFYTVYAPRSSPIPIRSLPEIMFISEM